MTWPCKPHVKPSNPELLCKSIPVRNNQAHWFDRFHGIKVIFHAIQLSDGAVWDVINGFRYEDKTRAH